MSLLIYSVCKNVFNSLEHNIHN